MTKLIRSITTSVGVINGRDGIYIDRLVHDIKSVSITVEGTVNGELCSNNKTGRDWLNFILTFTRSVAYECQGLDQCSWENDIVSSFDIQTDEFSDNFRPYLPEFNLYYLSAYDQMLKIVATDFKFEIIG